MTTHIALINTAAGISAKLEALSFVVKTADLKSTKRVVDVARSILQEVFNTEPYPVFVNVPGQDLKDYLDKIVQELNALTWDLEQMKMSPRLREAVILLKEAENQLVLC